MNNEKGGILILVMMVLFVLLLFSLTFYYLTTSQIIQTSHHEEINRVRIGAESAVSSALFQYRERAHSNLYTFITEWNINNPKTPMFPSPVTSSNVSSFISNYTALVEAMFEGLGNPLEAPVRLSFDAFDIREVTDLDTYLVISNIPITVNELEINIINENWPSFSNMHDLGISAGNLSFTDAGGYAFEITLPYRIITMAGTEGSGDRYSSQYNVVEQGVFIQEVNRRILNRWVLCSQRHRSSKANPDTMQNNVWFVFEHNFRGPVHTNDHHNVWGEWDQALGIWKVPTFTQLTSANNFYYDSTWSAKFPEGYIPMGAWSTIRNRKYPDVHSLMQSAHFNGHRPIVTNNPEGYHDRPYAYIDSVEFPENTDDQKLRSMHSNANNWNSAWDSLESVTVNTEGNAVVGGIYVPGDADYVHFSVVSTRNEHNDLLAPWPGHSRPSSPIHNSDQLNSNTTVKLDNGFQMIEILYNNVVTQILIQDDDYLLDHVHYNTKRTYIRNRPEDSSNWDGWQTYDGIPNGMLYVNGNLGFAESTGKGPGLSGVISGNLKPVHDSDGTIYYASDSRWNVTAASDIYIDGNVLYSYYGNENAVKYYGDPDGFNTGGYPYKYGDDLNHREFYDFDSSLFRITGDGRFIHQNMLGIFTADGFIWHNPNGMISGVDGNHFYIDAFVMASNEKIEVYNYSDRHWGKNGPLRLRGGYIQWIYGPHMAGDKTGFGRNFTWDRRAERIAPPYWPIEQSYATPNPFLIENSKRKPILEALINWPPSDSEMTQLMNLPFDNIK